MIAARVTVVILAFNEEMALPFLMEGLAVVPDEHEILVIDDGSTDRTAEILKSRGIHVWTRPDAPSPSRRPPKHVRII